MKRKWGQHFLFSSQIARRIVEAADLKNDDSVLEIGPGHGELTRYYADHVSEAVAIEIDPKFSAALSRRWGSTGRFRVITQDIRDLDFAALGMRRDPVVLGNLPYYVSKPTIRRLLDWGRFSRAIVTVQRELAVRLLAKPGDSEYSLFSVYFLLRAEGELLFNVEPSAFRPEPEVVSSVIRLRIRSSSRPNPPLLERLLRVSFASRRQKLLNNLKRGFKEFNSVRIARAMESAGIFLDARAQELAPEQFLVLAATLEEADVI
ncbi:MAG: 16S rRNA (adenine(1518)-N(6)/adenine(1519)-N(6))-dimethyltransferase RsmA [Elusimicrobiota bacterium]